MDGRGPFRCPEIKFGFLFDLPFALMCTVKESVAACTRNQISFPDTGKAHVRPQTPHTDVNRTHSRTYRFIYVDSHTDTVLLYTSCTDGLYFCVHYCTTWHYLNMHLWCTHYDWISCTAVCLYCSPVSVHLYCQLVLSNECTSKITFMNCVGQSKLIFLGIASSLPA